MSAKFFFFTSLTVVTSIMLNGCQKKLVTMTYDQSINFHNYKFGESIDDGFSNQENRIVADRGFFLIYHICSISNDDTNAQTFNFDLSKFYVVHNGKRYYHLPLQTEQFNVGSGGHVRDSVIGQWQKVFKEEIQTAPDEEVIPPHLKNILSVSWRFHIWIGDAIVTNDFETRRFELKYDNAAGKESYLLLSRGYDPDYKHAKDTEKSDLPLSCRAAN